jgi:cysteine synthase A
MPDDQAQEKYQILQKLGATVEKVRPASIVDPNHFVNIAKRRALELNALADTGPSNPRGFFCDQFENPSNFRAHYETTAPEIYSQTIQRGLQLDAIIMGAGTGGTLSGVACYLKPLVSNLKVVLADPQGSGLYHKIKHSVMFSSLEAEGTRKRHQVDTIVEGIGINRLTQNFNLGYSSDLIDDAIHVTDQEAINMSRYLLDRDGLFIGSSSSVHCVAAYKLAKQLGPGHTIVTFLCDHGSRHLTKFW